MLKWGGICAQIFNGRFHQSFYCFWVGWVKCHDSSCQDFSHMVKNGSLCQNGCRATVYRSSTKLSQWKIGQAPSSRMGVCKSWFQHSLYLSSPPQWNKNFNKFWNQHDWKKWLVAEETFAHFSNSAQNVHF